MGIRMYPAHAAAASTPSASQSAIHSAANRASRCFRPAPLSRAQRMLTDRHPYGREAVQLADLFCREARRRVKASFRGLWHNDDAFKYEVSRAVLGGKHAWVEDGIVGESVAAAKPQEEREPAHV